MQHVLAEATIENLFDLYAERDGRISYENVRRVVVSDARVSAIMTTLLLPTRLVQQLGLAARSTKAARSTIGLATVNVCDPVRLTIQGRDCTVDVMEVPDDVPVLIGQIPLEFLDFVIDPRSQRLIGNPAHGGEHMLELY